MANKASSITATHLRVTRLGPDGKFLTDAKASFTTKSFISLSFSPEYEDGDEFTQKNAAGAVCATYKAPDTLKRVNISLAICNPDPEFSNIIAGGTLLGTDGEGWAAPRIGEEATPNGVAIEAWSRAINDGKIDSAKPVWHWVLPYAQMRESGERVLQNDMLATEFEGWGVGNLGFGSGPNAPLWPHKGKTDSPYAYTRSTGVPAGEGYAPASNAPA